MRNDGRDKYIDTEEGLLNVIPEVKVEKKKPRIRKCRPGHVDRQHFKTGKFVGLPEVKPGWIEWRVNLGREMTKIMPRDLYSRPFGARVGLSKKEREEASMSLDKYFGTTEEDIKAIAATIDAEKDECAKFVMRSYMKILLTPNISEAHRMSILKIMLEYTKAKPVTKSEVKVEEKTADDWSAMMNGIAPGKGD